MSRYFASSVAQNLKVHGGMHMLTGWMGVSAKQIADLLDHSLAVLKEGLASAQRSSIQRPKEANSRS
jgi:hypothetical protein